MPWERVGDYTRSNQVYLELVVQHIGDLFRISGIKMELDQANVGNGLAKLRLGDCIRPNQVCLNLLMQSISD